MFTYTSPTFILAYLAAFTFLALFVTWAEVRLQRIRNFQTTLKIDFLAKVLSDDTLCDTSIEMCKQMFFKRLPSTVRLFFSSRPLHRAYWFTAPEVRFFFSPNYMKNYAV